MLGSYDYSVVSPVENIRYTNSENFPCEITLIRNGDNPAKTQYRGTALKICEFAERRKDSNTSVKIYGTENFGLHNIIGIEYGN